MKRTTEKPSAANQEARRTNDDLCKRLAEEYPEQFARWLFGTRGKVKVEKTAKGSGRWRDRGREQWRD